MAVADCFLLFRGANLALGNKRCLGRCLKTGRIGALLRRAVARFLLSWCQAGAWKQSFTVDEVYKNAADKAHTSHTGTRLLPQTKVFGVLMSIA